MDREGMQLLSLRLSRVLEDIGISRYVRTRRRKIWLMMEKMDCLSSELLGYDMTSYYFGSQTEGTTTLGMESDIDTLYCNNFVKVILDWSEWEQGKRNILVLKTDHSPPQHCWLQGVGVELPLPETEVVLPDDIVDNEGRVLITNTQHDFSDILKQHNESGEIIKHGPSKSYNEMDDFVYAHYSASLPAECHFLFHRPRPGHWPRLETLAKARQTGVFLVPQGFTEDPSKPVKCRSTTFHVPPDDLHYPHSKREWRYSTAIMERLLVFDMNTVQHKVYVFMKMIRKSTIRQVVDDRFSTFHVKTAMLFTIETYPPNIWKDDNFVQCVIYCLTTLLRWLKIRYCPHYTISGVNLFTGKLFKHEQNNLYYMISTLINNNLQCMFSITMDNLGKRLCSVVFPQSITHLKPRAILNELQISDCYEWYASKVNHFLTNRALHQIIPECLEMLCFKKDNGTALEKEAAPVLISQVCGFLASNQTSRCIHLGQPISWDILNLYRLSFDFDLLFNRLKFASMLYCGEQHEAAANCLTYCEGLLGPAVWQYCNCFGRLQTEHQKEFREKIENTPFKDMIQKYTASHVIFTQQDIHCVPQHLVFEMFRTIGDEDRQQRHPDIIYKWMDLIVIDAIPFLYYLQYLIHRQLNQCNRKVVALNNLYYYISSSEGLGHIDTAWNMLGHCYELENNLHMARICYTNSLQLYPRNNAANWHVARIMYQ